MFKQAVHIVGSMFMASEPCRLPWLHVHTVHQRLRSNALLLSSGTSLPSLPTRKAAARFGFQWRYNESDVSALCSHATTATRLACHAGASRISLAGLICLPPSRAEEQGPSCCARTRCDTKTKI